MGYQSLLKFSTDHTPKVQISLIIKMNPAVVFSAVLAVLSFHSAEAIFGSDIVVGSGALFTGTGGVHAVLAGGTAGAVAPVAAVLGAGILLKAAALLAISQADRKKRAAGDETDFAFAAISAAEPAGCVRRLICDLATGAMPASENDVILNLFGEQTPATSPKFDFQVAASLGKQLKSVQACEVRYSCPLSGQQIHKLFN